MIGHWHWYQSLSGLSFLLFNAFSNLDSRNSTQVQRPNRTRLGHIWVLQPLFTPTHASEAMSSCWGDWALNPTPPCSSSVHVGKHAQGGARPKQLVKACAWSFFLHVFWRIAGMGWENRSGFGARPLWQDNSLYIGMLFTVYAHTIPISDHMHFTCITSKHDIYCIYTSIVSVVNRVYNTHGQPPCVFAARASADRICRLIWCDDFQSKCRGVSGAG